MLYKDSIICSLKLQKKFLKVLDNHLKIVYDLIKMLLKGATQTTTERGDLLMKENLLRAKIVEKGMTIEQFCDKASFVRSTFDRKLTGQTEFNRDEIETIAMVLELTDDEIRNIFFPNFVAKNSNKMI